MKNVKGMFSVMSFSSFDELQFSLSSYFTHLLKKPHGGFPRQKRLWWTKFLLFSNAKKFSHFFARISRVPFYRKWFILHSIRFFKNSLIFSSHNNSVTSYFHDLIGTIVLVTPGKLHVKKIPPANIGLDRGKDWVTFVKVWGM